LVKLIKKKIEDITRTWKKAHVAWTYNKKDENKATSLASDLQVGKVLMKWSK
jgi:hypothetical protein